ncbi:MAG: hypothetical protein PHG67_14660 [Bacteroidales bacterium]|jgi:hypothetical protein|nr:hypothetical protein [Bacteroidales bacterium]
MKRLQIILALIAFLVGGLTTTYAGDPPAIDTGQQIEMLNDQLVVDMPVSVDLDIVMIQPVFYDTYTDTGGYLLQTTEVIGYVADATIVVSNDTNRNYSKQERICDIYAPIYPKAIYPATNNHEGLIRKMKFPHPASLVLNSANKYNLRNYRI